MIVAAGGMGERRGGTGTGRGDGLGDGEGNRAVCGDRKQAGWARMGRIQELIYNKSQLIQFSISPK